MRVSLFSSLTNPTPVDYVCTWPDLVALLSTFEEYPAGAEGKKAGKLWSGAFYPAGKTRKNENVEGLSAVVFDFDAVEDSDFASVLARVEGLGLACVWHTTHSHRVKSGKEGKGCYRLALPLGRSAAASEWRDVWGGLVDALEVRGIDGFDASSGDISRSYFLPANTPDVPGECGQRVGDAVDVDGVLEWQKEKSGVFAGIAEAAPEKRKRGERGPGKPKPGFVRGLHVAGGGHRDNYLASAGGWARAQGWGFEQIRDWLIIVDNEDCKPPKGIDVVERVAASMCKLPAGATKPFDDIGNAARLLDKHKHEVIFVPAWKSWLTWNAPRWQREGAEQALMRMAGGVARDIAKQIDPKLTVQDPKLAEKIRGFATRTATVPKMQHMVKAAEPHAMVMVDELDTHLDLFNTYAGVVDLRTGRMGPSDPALLFTKVAGARDFDPDIDSSDWEQLVLEIMGGDREMAAYLQRAMGYSLSGRVSEEVMFFAYGRGGAGKGTIMTPLLDAMGDYGKPGMDGLLLAKRNGDSHPTEVASLAGVRMVSCSELEEGKPWNENRIKQLTGGDPVETRRMKENTWTMRPTWKIWATANDKPVVRDTSNAIWRRLQPIHFTEDFAAVKDMHLKQKWNNRLAEVLAWAVRGAVEWYRIGLSPPGRVSDALKLYKEESDITTNFMRKCVTGDECRLRVSAAYQTYVHAEQEEGNPQPCGKQRFNAALRGKGFTTVDRDGYPCWRGLGLKTDQKHVKLVR